jgi:CheY-like chemotaxis protein
MVPNLRILIVDANEVRAAIIEEGLREAGYRELVRVSATTRLVAAIEQHDPDVVVIDLEDPSRDALADMFLVSRHIRRPITMFVDQSDSATRPTSTDAPRGEDDGPARSARSAQPLGRSGPALQPVRSRTPLPRSRRSRNDLANEERAP